VQEDVDAVLAGEGGRGEAVAGVTAVAPARERSPAPSRAPAGEPLARSALRTMASRHSLPA